MARMSFTPAPGAKVSDADALVTDVKDPKTFYSVAAPRKTGTLPTKAIVPGAETYEEGYHAGNVGGLSAVDADLAVGNIKKDVNIFGKVGTYEGVAPSVSNSISKYLNQQCGAQDQWVIKGTDLVPAAAIRVIAINCTINGSTSERETKCRAVYDGVQKYIHDDATTQGGECTFDEGSFAGVGSEATLTLEHWSEFSSSRCCGKAYYI